MDATFVDALKVPAILSTLRKVQHDSDSALRVLNTFYRENRSTSDRPRLSDEEEEALSDIIANAVEQSLGAVLLFIGAHGAFVHGGIWAGQAAQAFISINAMTAPKSQFVNPGRLFGTWSGRAGRGNLELLSHASRSLLAFELGRLADATGYHERSAHEPVDLKPKLAVTPRSMLTFAPSPGSMVQ